ncbi:TetR/AcrR family transcriptional regulator [Novosphingobium piscinae]|uniref:TetR/AcrR family transcriptional regulator n=1 Tax=Novosphingobium piscinae TaxID=1507448 RepID=A0A7X1FVG6_9SPHN|nr:TetR/AcrR family transcriptional regulator [Novosphingobium piscinae]MBC2667729.1 TetR/AcrR family transcriptional regulator [Novosphingobium piscinae]
MKQARARRPRDPEATRVVILEAACKLLAKDGPYGISLSEVALLAGVNRGTAYQHFETRERLIDETVAYVSDKLYRAVLGDPEAATDRVVEQVDMFAVTRDLALFAMRNPELCRVWLLQILASSDPSSDIFWREYAGSIARFAATELAEPGIDVEVFSIITLAAHFLWPVWAHAHSDCGTEQEAQAERFAREMLRLSLRGTIRTDKVSPAVLRAAALPADGDSRPTA